MTIKAQTDSEQSDSHPCLSCRLRGECLGRIKGCRNYTGDHGTVSADNRSGRFSVEQADSECCSS